MTGPPGLIGREVLADVLGKRGDCTARAEAGVRPKLEREGERERESVRERSYSSLSISPLIDYDTKFS